MANNDNYEYMRFLDITGVQQIWDACKQTFVQTVNGQGIDANGNVNVSGGSGGAVNFFHYEFTNQYITPVNLSELVIKANSGSRRYLKLMGLENNTTYTAQFYSQQSMSGITLTIAKNNAVFAYKDTGSPMQLTFTTDATGTFQLWAIVDALAEDTTIQIMLTKGTDTPAYTEYIGGVNSVILWQNGSPTSNMLETTGITLSESVANYNYLIIGYRDTQYSSLSTTKYIKVKSSPSSFEANLITNFWLSSTSRYISANRRLTFNGSTSFDVKIADIIFNGSTHDTESNFCVPIVIYGTNEL